MATTRPRETDQQPGEAVDAVPDDTADDGDENEPRPSVLERARTIRIRQQLVPYPVIALLHAAAAVDHAAGGTVTAATVGLYVTVAVVVWWVACRKDKANRRARRRYTTTIMLSGTAWLLWAADAGAGGWHAAVLWIAGYLLALPYWRRHSIPTPPAEAAVEPAAAPRPTAVPDELTVPRLWAANVSAQGLALPGSRLFGEQADDAGNESYSIQLRPGAQDTNQAIAATPKVASGLGLALDSVVIDPHPSGNMSQARLLVVRANPLHRTLVYPGPVEAWDEASGVAWVGRYADGLLTPWQVLRPGWGACGGIVIGGTGSGKSRLLEGIASTAAYSGKVAVWVADPQGGQSFPAWAKHADWAACQDPSEGDEILRMLRAMFALIQIRAKVNSLLGRDLHACTPAEPMVLGVVDECHMVLNPAMAAGDPDRLAEINEAIALADKIARMGRKAGVALILASQYPGLETFGNKDSLRNSLLAANAAILRTASKSTKGMLPGLQLDPSMLPDRPGTGYTIGARTAPFRGWLVEHPEDLAAEAPHLPLEKIAARTLGTDYTDRHQRRLTARADLAAELADLDPELLAALAESDPDFAESVRTAQRTRPARPRREHRPARTTPGGAVLELSLPDAPRFQIPAAKPTVPEPAVLSSPGGRQVYELIRSGVATKAELIERTGLSEARVRAVCNELRDAGLVDRPGHGRWVATDTAA